MEELEWQRRTRDARRRDRRHAEASWQGASVQRCPRTGEGLTVVEHRGISCGLASTQRYQLLTSPNFPNDPQNPTLLLHRVPYKYPSFSSHFLRHSPLLLLLLLFFSTE
uniref:Uncharacterized protein n=1 Tax=Oryza punctata TaxID=4537 RepID=A0A0E0LSR9_ORYPU